MTPADRCPCPRPCHRRAGEGGAVGGFEALPFGLLIFVAGTLLIANVWGVLDAKIAASGAAREAARAYVESTSGSVDGAFAEAAAAAAAAIAGHGRDPSRMTITPESPLRFERCAPATFVVRYRVPVLELPWVDGLGGRSFSVTARHRELVDPFRNDVPLGAGLGAPC